MSKKKKNNEPPSLFDSLDLFADTGAADTGTTGVPPVAEQSQEEPKEEVKKDETADQLAE